MYDLSLRHLAGLGACCSAVVMLYRFPEWGHPVTHILAFIQSLLVFAGGLLVLGAGINLACGLSGCLAALFLGYSFPRDTTLVCRVMGYGLCLLIFSLGLSII